MKIRTFALTAAAALLVAGSAFAQTGGSTGQNGPTSTMGTGPLSDKAGGSALDMKTNSISNGAYKSDDERMMYQNNMDMMRPFFTDDAMTTLKSEDEIESTYQSMDSSQQARLKKTCDNAQGKRGSYGTTTNTLCTTIGMM
jgi:hypothetical protein